jgi:hypothetical protein
LINHPGIVDVLDFGRDADGSPYIVMEHLQGLTVRALQRAVGPLRAGLATAIIAPALEALAAAHDAGVVHRDLKPANLFLSLQPMPSVRILDFGISKFSLGGEGVTQTGTTLGTPAYMSLFAAGRSAALRSRQRLRHGGAGALEATSPGGPGLPRPLSRPRRARRPTAVERACTAARLCAAPASAPA